MQTFIRLCAVVVYVLLGACGVVFGQVSSYQFSQDRTVALVPRDGTATPLGSGATLDDQVYANQAIGFPFTFNGQQYTSVTVGVNGWVSFGGTPNDRVQPISSPTANGRLGAQGIIALLAGDLRGKADAAVFTRPATNNGVREFVIQWNNVQNKLSIPLAVNTSYSMEITLRENGIITFEYGTFSIDPVLAGTNALNASVGLRGANGADILLRTITGNGFSWQNTRAASNANDVNAVGTRAFGTPENVRMTWTPAQLTPIRPQIPTLVSPASGVSLNGNFNLQWNAVAGALGYRVEIYNAAGNMVSRKNTSTDPRSQVVSTDFSPGAYRWRVQTNAGGDLFSSWSEIRGFTLTLTPRITSAVPASAQQGQTIQMDIVGVNSNFTQTQTVRLQQGNFTINGTIGSNRTATALRVSFAIPANAPIGAYSLSIDNVPTPQTAAFFVNAVSPPPPIPTAEVFSPTIHGFGFGNFSIRDTRDRDFPSAIWPARWYNQINYNNPNYPSDVRANGIPSNFPSWDDYSAMADAVLGSRARTNQGRNYTQAVINAWKTRKWNSWGGSCYGFATLSAMVYSGRQSLQRNAYSYAEITDNLRSLINRYMVSQGYFSWGDGLLGFGNPTYDYEQKSIIFTPQQTVEALRISLRDRKKYQTLGFNIPTGEGHQVVPYRIESARENNQDVTDIYIYDMNKPGQTNPFIRVSGNSWRYLERNPSNQSLEVRKTSKGNPWQNQGAGTLTVTADMSLQSLINTPSALKTNFATTNNSDSTRTELADINFNSIILTDANSQVINSIAPNVSIVNSAGQRISTVDKDFTDPEIIGSIPIRPGTGDISAISGFTIPVGNSDKFSITYLPVSTSEKSNLSFSTAENSVFASWKASSTTGSQLAQVDLLNTKLFLKTSTAISESEISYAKSRIGSDFENVIRIQNSTLAANDSLDVQLLNDGDSFIINNYNSAKTYDLTLQRGAERTFAKIQLGQNEQQRFFVQDWANIARSGVIALVDRGFDGVIDSTITFSDFLTTSVNDRNAVSIDRTSIQLEAYPNPSNGQMTLEYTLSVAATVQIDVLNLLGQPVMNLLNTQQFSGKHTLPAELSGIQNGTYFLRIRAGNATVVKPIQIIK